MRRLFPSPLTPPPTSKTANGGLDELADFYAYPEQAGVGGRAWLRANMVSSLDGAAHHEGRSQPLSSAADMRIFGTLRGLADAVVVGGRDRTSGGVPARAGAGGVRRPPGGARSGARAGDRGGERGARPGLLASALRLAAGAHDRADGRRGAGGAGRGGPGVGRRGGRGG
ncbi:hypothetical protein GCM10020000_17900 [Streptomyces olivoverticillatus]